jgi:hypothetical protein
MEPSTGEHSMIIVMRKDATPRETANVIARI